MAMQLTNIAETPEEREIRLRKAAAFRVKVLVVIAVGSIGLRLFISDPKRKAPIDYANQRNIKIVPGMLDTMPASSRAKLNPQLVAKMVLVDEEARRAQAKKALPPIESGPYKVADVPGGLDVEADNLQGQAKMRQQRRRIDEERERMEQSLQDPTKKFLVRFVSGGYVFAQKAKRGGEKTEIRLNRAMEANFPSHWVAAVVPDAGKWVEPVPSGHVRLKPAPGITVILRQDSARRVTVSGDVDAI